MQIEITCKGRFQSPSGQRLVKLAKDSVRCFFRKRDRAPDHVQLLAFDAVRGANPERMIEVVTRCPEMRRDPRGVPVLVSTEGTQGLRCLMTAEGYEDRSVELLIQNGPYLNRKRPEHADVAPVETPFAGHYEELESKDESPETQDAIAVRAPALPPKKLSPLEKLQANKVEAAEIERLKATVASVIYRKVGDQEMPELLLVPVEEITGAIMEHMELPKNSRDTYQGIVGSFYSAKISMFAIKYGSASDPSSLYTDWLFDTPVVLDFVGGKSNLAALTRVRDAEVRQREEEAKFATQNPPPSAEEVEEAVKGDFVADAALLDMVLQMVAGRGAVEEEARLAKVNATQLLEQVSEIEAKLEEVKVTYQHALTLVESARAKVSEYNLSPEVKEKIRAAKARLDSLVEALGI